MGEGRLGMLISLSIGVRTHSPAGFHARPISLSSSRKVTMDLTFTLADLTATSACELGLYTELWERAQNQSARPTPEKSERARYPWWRPPRRG